MAYENEIKEIDNRIAKNKEILFTFTLKISKNFRGLVRTIPEGQRHNFTN